MYKLKKYKIIKINNKKYDNIINKKIKNIKNYISSGKQYNDFINFDYSELCYNYNIYSEN